MRVKSSYKKRDRRRKILKAAKGYRGSRSRTLKAARVSVYKALSYAYRDRKRKKRDFRRLWIARINAALKEHSISYSRFIGALKGAEIELDRKVLADIAIFDSNAFGYIVQQVQ